MPTFECRKRGNKTKAAYEVCSTGSVACIGEKPPKCRNEPMMEIIEY